MLKVEDNCVISIISSMCWLDAFFGVNTSYIHLFTYMKFLKYNTVLGKLAGRIGTLRGPDLAPSGRSLGTAVIELRDHRSA